MIDFEKAFDSLSWDFVQNTLSFFNFGASIKKWFNIFYENATSAVCQCGFLSKFINVQRGCRQGDPLSCYIFILCAEVLSLKLKSVENIKGIRIKQTEHLLSQFADDTTVMLDGTAQSLNATLDVLSVFAQISGLRVNFEKTKVVWIGIKKYSSDSIKTRWKLNWNETSFKMLGITFHVDLEKMVDLNFKEKISNIEKMIKQWNRRALTPIGKITVIKTILISQLNHLFIMLPNPSDKYIQQINDTLYAFIWNGTSKINKNVLVKDYMEGV